MFPDELILADRPNLITIRVVGRPSDRYFFCDSDSESIRQACSAIGILTRMTPENINDEGK